MTVEYIQDRLKNRFGNHDYHLLNKYIFRYDWESDYFSVTSSGYCYEVEIKLSKSDFKADFSKFKHKIFSNIEKKLMVVKGREMKTYDKALKMDVMVSTIDIRNVCSYLMPNKFYFCCPDGLISVEDVPEYAGLIYVKEANWQNINIVKEAKFLHKAKLKLKELLFDKFYYESIRLNRENERLKYELDYYKPKSIK